MTRLKEISTTDRDRIHAAITKRFGDRVRFEHPFKEITPDEEKATTVAARIKPWPDDYQDRLAGLAGELDRHTVTHRAWPDNGNYPAHTSRYRRELWVFVKEATK